MLHSCTKAPSPLSYSPAAPLVPLGGAGVDAHEPDSAPRRLWLHGGGRAAVGGDEEGGGPDGRAAARGGGGAVPRHGRRDAGLHRPDGSRALRAGRCGETARGRGGVDPFRSTLSAVIFMTAR